MARRALITGITGQDGSYLAEFLLGKGYEVHGMVRRASTESFERINHLRPRLHLHHADLLDQLSIVTLLTMPALAIAKGRIGDKLGSSATKSEGRQNMLCAYLSGALLVGLSVNALFGAWWADPLTALLIAGVAVREGREAWQGNACCSPAIPGDDACSDGCCD